LSPND